MSEMSSWPGLTRPSTCLLAAKDVDAWHKAGHDEAFENRPFNRSRRRRAALIRPLRQRPVRPDEVAGVAVGVFLQIILMLGLGLPERSGGSHLGDHLARPKPGGIDVGDGVLRDPLLLVAGIEDRRAVAGAAVVALAVARRGIMDLEKEF